MITLKEALTKSEVNSKKLSKIVQQKLRKYGAKCLYWRDNGEPNKRCANSYKR